MHPTPIPRQLWESGFLPSYTSGPVDRKWGQEGGTVGHGKIPCSQIRGQEGQGLPWSAPRLPWGLFPCWVWEGGFLAFPESGRGGGHAC